MHAQRGFAIMLIVYAVAALAVMGAIYGVYRWIDHSWETTAGIDRGRKEVQLEWDTAKAEQRAKEAKQIDTATTKLGAGNAKAKIIYRTITRDVDKIVTRDVYRNVCLEPVGLSAANAALRGPDDTPRNPDKPMPKPDAAGGRDGIISPAKTD